MAALVFISLTSRSIFSCRPRWRSSRICLSVRNAVAAQTALDLAAAFERFCADDAADVAILSGAGNTFCAGYDLRFLAQGGPREISPEGYAPMGPSRMVLPKPLTLALMRVVWREASIS